MSSKTKNTNPITGLIHVTGEPDTGKTTFALACGFKPAEIAFFDDDVKTQPIADALKANGTPLGAYINLTKMSLAMREIEFHNLVMSELSKLEGKNFKALIFDTWTRFENTFHPVVQKDPLKYKQYYSSKGDIKGAEIWKASFDYEAIVLDKMMEVAPLVILVTHLKDHTIGAVKTGAQVPDCKKPVVEKSRMRIWLRHNPDGPAPIGLLFKRLSKVEANENGIVPVNVLPRKVNPCTWGRILDYWNDPIGDREPSAEETPNDFELSILDGVLTEDQKDALRVNRVEAETKQKEENALRRIELETRLSNTVQASKEPEFTLDDLINAFGEEEVKKANNGELPSGFEEVQAAAKALMGE